MRTFVIAEVACTHDGDYGQALRLVNLAKEIGCDAVKFQYCSDPEKLARRRKAPEYLEGYRLLDLGIDWLESLSGYCHGRGIEFICSVYLPEDIPIVLPWVKAIKVASFEAEAPDMLKTLSDLHEAMIIISLGMNARAWLWPGPKIKFLHCVSAYPTPIRDINLSQISVWPKTGLSDHTKHPMTGALAVGVGAKIIEFHMRLEDTDEKNADYLVSRNPDEAQEYVSLIRLAEAMIGEPGVNKVRPSEEGMLRYRALGERSDHATP